MEAVSGNQTNEIVQNFAPSRLWDFLTETNLKDNNIIIFDFVNLDVKVYLSYSILK